MKKIIIIFGLTTLIPFTQPLHAWWWTEHRQPTLENIIQDLQKAQADQPEDPYTNYNLGVAFYKAGKFSQAQANFDRALVAATEPELKKRCYFNLGNSLYRDALSSLPENWQTGDVAPETLDMAMAKTGLAIKKYDSVLLLDKQHEPTKVNQQTAKDLLEKLEKQKQQQQKQQDKNKDKQNGKGQGDQQNQKQQDKSPESKGQQGNDQKNADNQPKPNNGKDRPNDVDNKGEQGKDKPSNEQDGKKGEQQKTQDDSHNQPQPQQPKTEPTPPQGTSADNQKQESGQPDGATAGQPQPENMEQRGMRALLDNLQQDESKLQKELILKKLKENEKPRASSQRPW